MLNHLHIQNYRLFRDLHIDKLGQVNLIAGKNNTGKTALLEALRILQNKCSYEIITNVVHLRNALDKAKPLESLATLFQKSDAYDGGINYSFKINDLGWGIYQFPNSQHIKRHKGDPRTTTGATQVVDFFNYESPSDETIYVPFSSDLQINMRTGFWESIEFEDAEKKKIVDILNVISDRKIKQISMNGVPKIQFANGDIEKLTKSGDGANRLLTLALALVNAKNKMLLIDEFEVGLHHSVQEQLWDIIFKYATEWNIQVFVTTHSQDTVRSFYYVAEKTIEYKLMANYFTLNRTADGDVEAVNYDLEEMETAFTSNLEIR